MTFQNEKFEELISDQLDRQLEPQRGRAAAAFRAQLAAEARAAQLAADRATIAGGSKRRSAWARRKVSAAGSLLWIGLPSAVAAALAVAVTLHFLPANDNPIPGTGTIAIDKKDSGPLAGGGGGGIINPEGMQLVQATGIIENTPGELLILRQPQVADDGPTIRTMEYIQPAGPYPLQSHP